MANKIMGILGWVLLLALILGALFTLAEPLIWSDKYPEWVFYARVFIVLFAISTFAQLRLFNAVVKNSLFLIKLRDAVYKLTEKFPVLDRGLKAINVTLTNSKSSMDALRKSVDINSDSTDKLTDELERKKTSTKE